MLSHASFRLAILLTVGFVVRTIAVGQDSAAKPKALADEYIVGNWSVEGTVSGKATKGTMHVRPAAGGTCLLYNWSYESTPDKTVRGLAVGAPDPKTTDFVEYCFESDGSHFISRFAAGASTDTGVGYGEQTGTYRGKPYRGKITVDRKGRDEFLFTVASEQGEDVKFIFRRVQDEQAVSPAYEHLKELEDYLGTWLAEETLNQELPGIAKKGDKVTYRAAFRWIQNKAMMQMDFAISVADGKNFSGRYLFGWDAGTKTIIESGFDSGGGRDWATLKKEGSDKWIWDAKWLGADGTQGSGIDTTTMLDDNNTHVHEYTNTTIDGKPQPDRKVVYKRVK